MKTQSELFKTFGDNTIKNIDVQYELEEQELLPGVTTVIYVNISAKNKENTPISNFYLTELQNFKLFHNDIQMAALIQSPKIGQLKTLITGKGNGQNTIKLYYKDQNVKAYKNSVSLKEAGILQAAQPWDQNKNYSVTLKLTSSGQLGFKQTNSDKLFMANVSQGLNTISKKEGKLYVNNDEITGLQSDNVYVVCKIKSQRVLYFENYEE